MRSFSPERHDQAPEALAKLDRKSLAERIADELRDQILLEKLRPGSTIPERETADALGVSRTPLRESLRILAAEGLIEIAPNRAPRVAKPTLAEIESLLQVQGALEAMAGELACKTATQAELLAIKQLEEDMREMSDTSEPLAFFQQDMAFHESIVAASANRFLIETHRTYNARLWRARFISSRQRINRPGTLQQHRDIVDALLARKPSRCAKALRVHLKTGYQNIKAAQAAAAAPTVDPST